jgi:glycosyltransferase involved in cell wall biosynthesis
MNAPLLTVAVPTYNGARHLADALRSIVAQAGAEFDLIVSDDHSTDQTLEIVRAEAGDRARTIVNSERLGLAGNWNQCVTLSRTPFVAIVHQDDMLLPGHLAAHVGVLRGDDRIGLVASASNVIDERGHDVPASVVERGGLGPVDRTFAPGEVVRELLPGNPLRCSAVTLRVEAHADLGGFNPALRYILDWDFWLRVGQRWRVAWLARPTAAIRWHAGSETHRLKSGTIDLDETQRWIEAHLADEGLKIADVRQVRKAVHDRLARAYLSRAYESIRSGEPELARLCLARALRQSPTVAASLARDPRLALAMAATAVAPRLAARLFTRPLAPAVPSRDGRG